MHELAATLCNSYLPNTVGTYNEAQKTGEFTLQEFSNFSVKKLAKKEVNQRLDEPIIRKALESPEDDGIG